MNPIKKISLFALAATAVMAFAGAGSASAAVKLCKVDEKVCATANTYALPQAIKGKLVSGTRVILHQGPINNECSASEMKGKATASDASELLGMLEGMTLSSCTCPEQKLLNLPYNVSALALNAEGHSVWHVTPHSGGGKPSMLTACGGLSCVIEKSNILVEVLLRESGLPVVNVEVELEVNGSLDSGFSCLFGGNATWQADYEIVEPDPVFITE